MSSPNPLEQLPLSRLRQRSSWKWQTFDQDVLPLWVAEMDVPLARPIVDALVSAVAAGDLGYPTGSILAESLEGFAYSRWGWQVPVARTAVVPDVMSGIFEVVRLLTRPGDAVVVNPPVYSPFYSYADHFGRSVIDAPLGADHRIDLETLGEAFEKATVGGRSAVYLICNPHNPTGVVHSRGELEAVLALARAHGVRVIADEIHGPLVLAGADFVPVLSLDASGDSIAVTSASKAWNLAGLKAGLVVAGEEAAADLARLPSWLGRGASHLGVIAHAAAYSAGADWLDALLDALAENRDLLGRLVSERLPGVELVRPEGTYLAWLDCRELEARLGAAPAAAATFSDMSGATKLFHDHGRVALSSGHVFGQGGAGYSRLNYAASRTVLTEAIGRMSHAIDSLV